MSKKKLKIQEPLYKIGSSILTNLTAKTSEGLEVKGSKVMYVIGMHIEILDESYTYRYVLSEEIDRLKGIRISRYEHEL